LPVLKKVPETAGVEDKAISRERRQRHGAIEVLKKKGPCTYSVGAGEARNVSEIHREPGSDAPAAELSRNLMRRMRE